MSNLLLTANSYENDVKTLQEAREKYGDNGELIAKINEILEKWQQSSSHIDTLVWDEQETAEAEFNILRQADKEMLNTSIDEQTPDCEWDVSDDEDEDASTSASSSASTSASSSASPSASSSASPSASSSTDTIGVHRPKQIFGNIPGQTSVDRQDKVITNADFEKHGQKNGTQHTASRVEQPKTEFYDLNMIVDDIIKVIREIHQNPDFIKWIQEHFTGNGKIKQTLSSLKPLMKTPSCSISNKSRIETISSYKQGYKQYNIINLIIKGKTTFSINLIEELYTQIVYILHKNLHTYDVDKLVTIFDLLVKNKGSNLLAYISSKTLDSDKYCIKS